MAPQIAGDLIVFDLDGTLADTLPDLTVAANFALRRLGLPEHSPEAVRGMIGGGERKLMERVLGPAQQDRGGGGGGDGGGGGGGAAGGGGGGGLPIFFPPPPPPPQGRVAPPLSRGAGD